MNMRTAYSTKPLPEAVASLQLDLRGAEPKVVVFFASTAFDPATLSQAMQDAFPRACVAGCSSAGEIANGQMLTGSVVAMSLDSEVVRDAAAVVVGGLAAGNGIRTAIARLEEHFGAPAAEWDVGEYVGIVLADGLSGAEERLMEELGDATDVFFVGGSAGDDLKFSSTYVCAGGQAGQDSAALVLLRLNHGFDIVKTQSFSLSGKTLVATKVDEKRRTVIEFNGKPALETYAEALGVTPERAADCFFEHPLGLVMEGDPFVRSPQRAEGDSIVFYCQIREGAELQVLDATDIVTDTRRAVEAKVAAAGGVRGLIDFQCILRTIQLRAEDRCAQYGAVFAGIPMAGFSTYGEAYLGHLNQTSTILLFR